MWVIPKRNRLPSAFADLQENTLYCISRRHICEAPGDWCTLLPDTVFHDLSQQSQLYPIVVQRQGNIAHILDVLCYEDKRRSFYDTVRFKYDILRSWFRLNTSKPSSARYDPNIPVSMEFNGLIPVSEAKCYASYWIKKSDIFQEKNSFLFRGDVLLLPRNPDSSLFLCVVLDEKGRYRTDWSIEEQSIPSRNPDPLYWVRQISLHTDQMCFTKLDDAFLYLEELSSSIHELYFLQMEVLSYLIHYPLWVDSHSLYMKLDGTCWCSSTSWRTLNFEKGGAYTIQGRFIQAPRTQKWHLQIELTDDLQLGMQLKDTSFDSVQVCCSSR